MASFLLHSTWSRDDKSLEILLAEPIENEFPT
jgi:hypothetical protein